MGLAEAAAMIAVCVGAFAQAVSGIGFALVCSPLLVLSIGPRNGVLLANLIGGILSVLVIAREWRSIRLRHAIALFIPAAAIAPFAGIAVHNASPATLSIIAGVLILSAVGLLASGLRSHRLHGVWGAIGAGAMSGTMSVFAGVGGPPVALYAVNAQWEPSTVRSTLNVYFIALTFVIFAVRGTPDASFGLFGLLLIAMIVGFLLGRAFVHKVNAAHLRRVILIVATVGGASAIVNGFLK